MALRFEVLQQQILIVLYDYMMTSDHETFWFSIPSIQEAISETSGAFIKLAVDALTDDGLLEEGSSDGVDKDIFALTRKGIASAEKAIEERGISIEDYAPAPDADVILSKLVDPDNHKKLNDDVKALAKELAASNSVGQELGDDRELIKGEIEAASTLVQQDRFRVGRLRALIMPTLKYMADKFSGQAIGEMAKALVHLLTGLS
jgi:hypothetical protein